MEDEIRALLETAAHLISQAQGDVKALERIRVRFLGRKGEVAGLFKGLTALPEDERRRIGKVLNEAKVSLETIWGEAMDSAREKERSLPDTFDVTIPGRRPLRGHLHPITQTAVEIGRIFGGLGFETVEAVSYTHLTLPTIYSV